MKKLLLEYHIDNLSVLFEKGTTQWERAEFTVNEDNTAHLKVCENDIEPEQIMQTWKKLEERGLSFEVAMKYLLNRDIVLKKITM